MKIEKLKINGYGQLSNREINLSPGINVIKGYNEAGKSTLLSFISSSLYGIDKNKNGQSISEYNKYKPWNNTNFSGSIVYRLDDSNEYEIYRDFNSKKTIITDSNLNDLTNGFKTTRKGVEILEEQIGIDKTTFKNSSISFQKLVVLDDKDKSQIIQKMTNLVSTGEENVSYTNIVKKLSDRQVKEIGNNRTKNKPINEIEEELLKLQKKQEEILDLKYKKDNIIEDRKKIQDEFSELEKKKNFLTDVREHFLKDADKNRNLDIYNNIKQKQDMIMDKKQLKADTITIPAINPKYKKVFFVESIIALMLIIAYFAYEIFYNKIVVSKLIQKNKTLIFVLGIILGLAIAIGITYMIANVKRKKEMEKLEKYNREIEKEILVLRKDIMDLEKDLEKMQKGSRDSNDRFYRLMKIKYLGKIDNDYLEEIINKRAGEIAVETKKVENKYETAIIDLSKIDAENKLLEISENKLAEVVERKENLNTQKEELENYNKSFEIAKELLEQSYNEMKDNLGPSFNTRLSYITKKITNGKYNEVKINRNHEIKVKTEWGDIIDLSLLSTGTIEQVNLALRLAILEHITAEKLPIIVDEAFAFYDDQRLCNTIKFLSNEYKDRQIILFTCSNREMESVDKMDIDVNYISI